MNPIPDPTKKLPESVQEPPAPSISSKAQELLQGLNRGVTSAERSGLIDTELAREVERMRREKGLLEERNEIFGRLIRCARSLSSILDLDALLGEILQEVVALTGVDRGLLLLNDGAGKLSVVCGHERDGGRIENPAASPFTLSVAQSAFGRGVTQKVTGALDNDAYRNQKSIAALGLDTIVCVPMMSRETAIGVLYLDSTRAQSLPALQDSSVLEAFAAQAAIAVENAQLHRRLVDARTGLERENRDLRRALPGSAGLGAILGRSRRIEEVRRRIGQLQEVDCPVLILGETGTGKDLVAQAIHMGSARASAPFQVVHCGALPEPLLESELFGHRKGAFTGSIENKLGLVEAAEGGTLFLDEIGEMALSLQVKLLRVLENREIRRVGAVSYTHLR
ncbi:MAG: sigma 54-interacting transcriptional regulator, partial [Candidatus Eisenbacteria bacterium]|nr:sigma 54-interacting transcriptional regulator [Candidatus Eisenbacteria bacterium]